ncbi:MAG: hypothetical protein WCG29_11460, partial [Desulfomonile sp.]
ASSLSTIWVGILVKPRGISVWEACHQMSKAPKVSESTAGALLARMPEKTDAVRQFAYQLYTVCERKGWAEEALIYNELVTSWHSIVEISRPVGVKTEQGELAL